MIPIQCVSRPARMLAGVRVRSFRATYDAVHPQSGDPTRPASRSGHWMDSHERTGGECFLGVSEWSTSPPEGDGYHFTRREPSIDS